MLNKNTVITSERNTKYIVISLISSGTGQGDIYKVSSDGREYAMKLFYGEDEEKLLEQINILMKRGKACTAYVHPLDIVRIDGRIGYIMEYVPDSYLPGSILYNGIERDGAREELPFHTKLSLLYDLAEAVAVLYHAGLAMLDLKFDNLKVDPESGSVKIIDTDTIVSANGKNIIEGTVGFMPPLTMLRKEVPSKYNDSYALAVMIFMTLIGNHPLMGRAGDMPHDCDMETYLFAENPVYVAHPTDDSNRPSPEDEHISRKLAKYPKVFLDAMQKTFVDGLYDGEKRTTPEEWLSILRQVYELAYCCSECGEEQFFTDHSSVVCSCCGSRIMKPLLLKGDKVVPLFLGSPVIESNVWNENSKPREILKVVTTPYRAKCGLLVEQGKLILHFQNGRSVVFEKGKTVPLFMNAEYEYEQKIFRMEEM